MSDCSQIPKRGKRILFLIPFLVLGCSPDQKDEKEQKKDTQIMPGDLLIYDIYMNKPVPEKAIFKDGSCWDLTKLPSPWVITGVTNNSVSVRASTEDLKIPHYSSEMEEQKFVNIGFRKTQSEDNWRMIASPRRINELYSKGVYDKINNNYKNGFEYFILKKSNGYFSNIIDVKNNISCISVGAWISNGYLRCELHDDNLAIFYTLSYKAIDILGVLSTEYKKLINDLKCVG